MTRQIKLLFLFLFIGMATCAQTTGTVASGNAVLYKSSRHLFQNGNCITLVSLNIEWPRALLHSKLEPLQRFLTSYAFDKEYSSFDEGWQTYRLEKGMEIMAMPKDTGISVRYRNIQVKELWYEVGRYLSLYINVQERNETSIVSSKTKYFTYDLISQKVMTASDVFNLSRLNNNPEYRNAFEEVLSQAMIVDPMETGELRLDNVPRDFCLCGENIYFDIEGTPGRTSYAILAQDYIDVLLAKNFKKWQKQQPSVLLNENLSSSDIFGEAANLPQQPDSTAQFPGGPQALYAYLGKNISYALELGNIPSREVFNLVVEEDGSISDITVLTPSSIDFERIVVETLRLMPRWQPAMLNDKAVRSSAVLPITLKKGEN